MAEAARDRPPATLAPDAALLYPGKGVAELARLAPAQRPSTLVVLDGTWHQARSLFRDNGWLQRLPRYGLAPVLPSRYRLRKEPAIHCLSTIEAIVQALQALEPDTLGLDELLASFESMIDDQLAIITSRRSGRRRALARRYGGLHRGVVQHPERVVVVSGEAAPRGRDGAGGHRLLHWVAARGLGEGPATEVFERLVRPPPGRFPNACHLAHMGLSAGRVRTAGSAESARAAWRAFAKDDDIIVSWTSGALRLLAAALTPKDGALPHTLQLKSAYCSHHKGRCGRLDEVVARLGLRVPQLVASGRAARTVEASLALLSHMRGEAQRRAVVAAEREGGG